MTRNEYITTYTTGEEGYKTFRAYYNQFITKEITDLVRKTFGVDRLKKAYKDDKHFNNIPLSYWDRLAGLGKGCNVRSIDQWNDTGGKSVLKSLVDMKLIKTCGEGWSLSTAVCIAKTAAENIALAE